MVARYEALQYIADNSEKKLGKLRAEKKTNEENIKKEEGEFMDKGLAFIIDKSEVKVKQESPFKIADIVLYCHAKENEFTITLSNCVQTNRSWYLGDAFVPEGSGFESAVSAKENKNPGKFGQMLAKAGESQQKVAEINKKQKAYADSLREVRLGYETKNHVYYNHQFEDLPLKGYYIKKNGEKVDAIIAYRRPQFLIGISNSLFICKEVTGKKVDFMNPDNESNFKEWVKYDDIKAFFVADQLYARHAEGYFTTIISEGAIHTYTGVFLRDQKAQLFEVYPITQKLNGKKYGKFGSRITEDQLLGLMADAPQIVQGYKNGEYTLEEAEIQYNVWYEENNPGKVNYIFGKDYGVTKKAVPSVKSAEVIAYEEETISKYNEAHTVPKQDYFGTRPLDPTDAIASVKPEVTVKKESFVDRLNRIKADGNKVGVLVRCNNLYVNPGKIGGDNKLKIVGSYAPLKGTEKVAQNVAEELKNGFGVDVFEVVDYSLIPVKDGQDGKMDDWWTTKYKMIVIYDITPAYAAMRNSAGEFVAYMTVNSEMLLMAAEDKQQKRLKYVTAVPTEWGNYKSEPFTGPASTDFDIIQELREAINPPTDDVVIEALIASQKEPLDKFIKKRSK